MSKDFLKISEFAKLTGLSEQSLRDWDKDGRLKCHHKSAKGGYRYYTYEQVDEYLDKAKRQVKVVCYCRACEEALEDIKRQETVLVSYATNRGIPLNDLSIVRDMSDGVSLGDNKLKELLMDISSNLVKELIVEDVTRLSYVGYRVVDVLCKAHNCKLTILSGVSKVPKIDTVSDITGVVKELSVNLGLSHSELKDLLCDIVDNL